MGLRTAEKGALASPLAPMRPTAKETDKAVLLMECRGELQNQSIVVRIAITNLGDGRKVKLPCIPVTGRGGL
jgi:hypothetical protein